MKNTKLIQILSTFTKDNVKEFDKFIASPYFSRGRDLIPFYKILKSYYPGFNNDNFTYEKIYRRLNPKVKFNKSNSENAIRVMSSELAKLAEDFLVFEHLKGSTLRRRISLMEIFVNANLNKLFAKVLLETKKDMTAIIDGYTSKDFVDLYFFTMLEVMFSIHNNNKVMSTLKSQVYVLNFFFLCAANFINNSYRSKINFNLDNGDDLAEQFMQNFDHKNFISYLSKKDGIDTEDKHVLELCFYALMHTLDRDNPDFIYSTEKLFYNAKHLFKYNHKLSFYFLLDAAFAKRNEFKKLKLLYDNLLEDKIYEPVTGKEMPFHLYRSILNNLIELNKTEDAKRFILKYVNYLRTDKKDSFHNFGSAQIEFRKKNFSKALDYISKVEMLFFFFKYDIRNLYLVLYYELDYSEEAYSLIDSYQHFLKGNKDVSDVQRKHNKKFVEYFRVLLNHKTSKKNIDLKKFRLDVSAENKLPYLDWLLEKSEERKRQVFNNSKY